MNAFQQHQERKAVEAEHNTFRSHFSDEQNAELDSMRAEGNAKLQIGYAVFGAVLVVVGLAYLL